jgi:cobalamin synthase
MNAQPPVTAPPLTGAQATMPTLGSILGSIGGTLLAAKIGATDPLISNSIVVGTTAFVTGFFHWLGQKFGVTLA